MQNLIISCLSLSLLLLSCASESKSGKVIHPTKEFISELNSLENTISLDSLRAVKDSYGLYKHRKVLAEIGNDEHINGPYFLPNVKDITVDEHQNLYMSIPKLNEIRVFTKEGIFKQTVGRPGRGPGEFMRLSNIDYDKKHKLLIATDLREIELFSARSDTVIPLTTIYTKVGEFSDVCILGDSFYINGFLIIPPGDSANTRTWRSIRSSKPIHKFDIDTGEYKFSFGYKYTSASNFGSFDGLLSKTIISCNEETDTVIGILKNFPLISGYDPDDGSLKWRSGIKNFRYKKFEENTGGSDITLGDIDSNKKYDFYTDLLDLGNGYSLLQILPGIPQGFSLEKAFDFISSEFNTRPILINSSNGELTFLPKQKKVIFFQNNDITALSILPKDPYASLKITVVSNSD